MLYHNSPPPEGQRRTDSTSPVQRAAVIAALPPFILGVLAASITTGYCAEQPYT